MSGQVAVVVGFLTRDASLIWNTDVGDHIHSHFYYFLSGNRLQAVSLFLENRGEERKTGKGHARTLTCFAFFSTNFRGKETLVAVCSGNGVNYNMVTVRSLKLGPPRQ